jgi:hypothetical protein
MAKQKKKTKTEPFSFEKLKKEWYTKLKKEGFEDIERHESATFALKSSSNKFNTADVARDYYAKSEYYSMARKFLHDYKFSSNLEKVIWEYHTEAISARDIAKLLVKVKVIKPNKDNISQIIARLAQEMKKIYLVGYHN